MKLSGKHQRRGARIRLGEMPMLGTAGDFTVSYSGFTSSIRIETMSTSSESSKTHRISPDDPRHPEYGAYLAWLRRLTMEERGRMILEKCREAAEEEHARIASGLPPTTPPAVAGIDVGPVAPPGSPVATRLQPRKWRAAP